MTLEVAKPNERTQFLDKSTVLQETVEKLEAMGINKIITMTHVGYSVNIKSLSLIKGVDIL